MESPENSVEMDDKALKKKNALQLFFKISIGSEIFLSFLLLCAINILYFSSWGNAGFMRQNMKVAIWLPFESSNTGIIENSLKYIVTHYEKFPLNFSFQVLTSQDTQFESLESDVRYGRYWAAFAVNQNASNQIMNNIFSPPGSLIEPSCTYWYDQVRAGPSLSFAFGVLGNSLAGILNVAIKSSLVPTLYNPTNPSASTSVVNPNVLARPVTVETVNLHPISRYGLFQVIGGGVMQMFFTAVFHAVGIVIIHADMRGHGVGALSLIAAMGRHRTLGAFLLAVWPIVIPFILGIHDKSISSNPGLIFSWWAFLWLSISVLQNIIYHIGKIFGLALGYLISLCLLFLMIVSCTFSLPFEAMAPFYRIGEVFPFFFIVQGQRSLLFGSEPNLLSQSIGGLVGWFVLFLISTLFFVEFIDKRFHMRFFYEEGMDLPPPPTTTSQSPSSSSSSSLSNTEYKEIEMSNAASSSLPSETLKDPENQNQNPSHSESNSTDNNNNNNNNNTQDSHQAPSQRVDSSRPLSFYHPSMRPFRKQVFLKGLALEAALSLLIFVQLLIVYSASWNPPHYFHNIKLVLANFNTSPESPPSPANTQFLDKLFMEVGQSVGASYGFILETVAITSECDWDCWVNRIDNHEYYGMFALNAGAGVNLANSLTTPGYTPSPPDFTTFTFVFDGSRGGAYLNTQLKLWSQELSGVLGGAVSVALLSQPASTLDHMQPTALVSPTSFFSMNLHPVPSSVPGVDGTISFAAIVSYLGGVVIFSILLRSHAELGKVLELDYLVRMRNLIPHLAVSIFILPFWLVISLVWYGMPMSPSMFFQYWAYLWLGMCCFISIFCSLIHIFGLVPGAVLNIVLLSLSSASGGGTMAMELLPPFFRVGYALPYYNIILGARYILFGSDKKGFHQALGVLFAWVFGVIFLVLTLEPRRKFITQMKEKLGFRSLITPPPPPPEGQTQTDVDDVEVKHGERGGDANNSYQVVPQKSDEGEAVIVRAEEGNISMLEEPAEVVNLPSEGTGGEIGAKVDNGDGRQEAGTGWICSIWD